jgi:hypothetical protein
MRFSPAFSNRLSSIQTRDTWRQRIIWKIVLGLFLSTFAPCLYTVSAEGQIARTYDTAIAKNIVTDFGAKCDGVANDNAAFTAFNTWGQAGAGSDASDRPHDSER